MHLKTLAIVGVGLIGGSIGLAVKRRGLAERVLGAGRRLATLERARELGAIDEGSLDIDAVVHQAELAVFCTPVDVIAEQILAAAPGCAPGTVLTDAGSTKLTLVRCLDGNLPAGVSFVGSPPLAGSHQRGPEHARADLFQGRVAVVTPTPATDPAALEKVKSFWQALGSHIKLMTPVEHDDALALTSHLPHLVASSLAGMLPDQLFDLAATGFRDTTRIAAGSPEIWAAILGENCVPVREALDRFSCRLGQFREALVVSDTATLAELLVQGERVRNALGS